MSHGSTRSHKNSFRILQPHRNFTVHMPTHFPRTIRDWNGIPTDPVLFQTVDTFKTCLNASSTTQPGCSSCSLASLPLICNRGRFSRKRKIKMNLWRQRLTQCYINKRPWKRICCLYSLSNRNKNKNRHTNTQTHKSTKCPKKLSKL